MDKNYYYGALIPEIIRYAKLSRMDPDHLDEYGAAIFATWYTQNPLHRPDRDNINNFEEEQDLIVHDKKSAMQLIETLTGGKKPKPGRPLKKSRGIRFTAHTHPDEPLLPSPDDLSVCSRSEENIVHFIIDGYLCRKVKKRSL